MSKQTKHVRAKLNQKGFSLIELMVVVAIIGILATIAVPQLSKMQAKAKQSEAKGHLSGIYTAEKAFNTEWSQYYGSMRTIGYAPDGRGLRYNAGFAALGVAAPAAMPGADAASFAINIGTSCTYSGAPAACNFNAQYTVAAVAGSVNPTATTFTAIAAGNPNSTTLGNVDVWSIDQDKNMQWVTNGIQ